MQLDIGELAAVHRRISIDPASDECRTALRKLLMDDEKG